MPRLNVQGRTNSNSMFCDFRSGGSHFYNIRVVTVFWYPKYQFNLGVPFPKRGPTYRFDPTFLFLTFDDAMIRL